MVFPLTAGIVVGRIGCWLAGLHDDTHGLPTALPWGLDLGDGVLRHPSPLYEIVFLAALAGVLRCAPRAWPQAPGLKFKCWLAAYLAWRLFADGLKPVPVAYPLGLSGIQWVCIVALAFYLPVLGRAWRQSSTLGPAPGPTSSPNQDSTCCKY
jgi:prolipoprotein diacylglyceryltransferase